MPRGNCGGSLLRHHHLDELLVVDLPVAIDVRLADHLVDLLVRELLAEVLITWRSSAAEMKPLPSLSNTLNASFSSSSESVSFILRAMRLKNSGKSIVPSH